MLRSSSLIVVLAWAGWAQAQSVDQGVLVGIEAGFADSDLDSDVLFGVYAGYQFGTYFGVEAGYVDLGNHERDDRGSGGAFTDLTVKGYRLMGQVHWPALERLSLQGKLGLFVADEEVTASLAGTRTSNDDSKAGLAVELGVYFLASDRVRLHADLGHYRLEGIDVATSDRLLSIDPGDINAFKVGISYHF